MPTTADMLDDLLSAALEFEQPHMREKVSAVPRAECRVPRAK